MASFSLFGYGSLTFKPPPFPFTSRTGFILNHARRFAQRSHDHRGTPAAYGLVSTLVDAAEWEEYTEDEPIELRPTRCYGTIFTFDDASSDFESEVWRYLDHREKDGFTRKLVDVYAVVDGVEQVIEASCIVYVGEISNPSFHSDPHWIAKVARRIATSAGPSGTNREYLYNLAAAIRGLSTVEDPYLVLLERLVRAEVALQEKQRALGVD